MLDCDTQPEIEENFNRVMDLIGGSSSATSLNYIVTATQKDIDMPSNSQLQYKASDIKIYDASNDSFIPLNTLFQSFSGGRYDDLDRVLFVNDDIYNSITLTSSIPMLYITGSNETVYTADFWLEQRTDFSFPDLKAISVIYQNGFHDMDIPAAPEDSFSGGYTFTEPVHLQIPLVYPIVVSSSIKRGVIFPLSAYYKMIWSGGDS